MGKSNAGKGPKLPNVNELIQAGIDPVTGLPLKFSSGSPEALEQNLKMLLRIIDEQDATNRYVWTGTEALDLSGQEIERLLYYKGQLVFFYFEELDKFYLMPYALNETIDFYGRFNTVKPVPMTSGVDDMNTKEGKAKALQRYGKQLALLSEKKLNVVYDVVPDDLVTKELMTKTGVLLHDYTKQLSQTIIPRQQINDPLIHVMAECIPFMRTSLIAGSGIKAMRVNDADQSASVSEANKSVERAAKTGKLMIPVTGAIEMQELTNGQPIKSEEYMLALQSLDNLRKSTYGISNGGLYEKKAHELESENEMNMGSSMNQLQDGLAIRQRFCNIVNSIWGIGIWCEAAESIVMQDMIENNEDSKSLNTEENEEQPGDEENGDN